MANDPWEPYRTYEDNPGKGKGKGGGGSPVPEPGTFWLVGLIVLFVFAARWSNRRRS